MGLGPNRASYVIDPPIIGYEASRVADGSQLLASIALLIARWTTILHQLSFLLKAIRLLSFISYRSSFY